MTQKVHVLSIGVKRVSEQEGHLVPSPRKLVQVCLGWEIESSALPSFRYAYDILAVYENTEVVFLANETGISYYAYAQACEAIATMLAGWHPRLPPLAATMLHWPFIRPIFAGKNVPLHVGSLESAVLQRWRASHISSGPTQ
jgi:hypothetical protein